VSLRRRLLLYLAAGAPLVWAAALAFSVASARLEVNELFDTELVRLARQVEATLPPDAAGRTAPAPRPGQAKPGDGDLRDLAVAVWDTSGRLVVTDREGGQLRYRAQASGFVDEVLEGDAWRVYYLPSAEGGRLVAAGQRAYERDELVRNLVASQMVPWLVVLPVLLVVMAWGVRRALAPVDRLSLELRRRPADDLAPLAAAGMPDELQPLVEAMNGLFDRIGELITLERRFTADAAHELRTPLAVLRAQWDVVRRAGGPERAAAEARLDAGLERMDRLVAQLLTLSRAEAADRRLLTTEVDWPRVVEQVTNDVLPLLRRRRIELSCDWPVDGRPALPLMGEPDLLAAMLRNLVDNAARYAPEGSAVRLRMRTTCIEVENEGEPLPGAVAAALGERFHRPDGQQETGSGLGVSIVRRIAQLHGLQLHYGTGEGGRGVRVVLRF
jgi:two-component system sensor histidine kinase QseC